MSRYGVRPSRWMKSAAIAALATVVTLAWGDGARAETSPTAPHLSIPKGYVSEQTGPVAWIYPASAKSEVRDLQKVWRSSWNQATYELGATVSNRFSIRVGINPADMQLLAPPGVRLPQYATGIALPEQSVILLTLTAPDSWEPVELSSVLKHEVSHLALYRAVDGKRLPRWFSEGVAIIQADEHSFARVRALWEGSVQGRLIPLEGLSNAFPARRDQVNLAYAQSADFVAFLRDGDDNLHRSYNLIGNLRKGMAFDSAVLDAYHVPIGFLEREWRYSLQRRFGRVPLLLTGVGTVWVLASIILLAAYVKTRRKHAAILRRWTEEEAEAAEASQPAQNVERDPAMPSIPPPIPSEPEPPRPDASGVPTVQYDGRHYTLH